MKLPTKKSLERHIRKLTLASLLLSVALAALSATMLVSTATSDLTLTHVTRDQLAGNGSVVLAPASEIMATVQLRYVLAVVFGVSALFSLLIATKLRKNYERMLKTNVSGWRWLFMGVGAALLLEFVYLLVGVNDLMVLKLGAGLVFTTALLGWLSERENKAAGRPKWLAYVISLFTGLLAWLPVFGSLAGTSLYGNERFSWYVYAVSGITFLGFTGYALNQYLQLKKHKFWREYLFAERNYMLIGLVVKLAVFAVVMIALHK